jgi:hypothetical protein
MEVDFFLGFMDTLWIGEATFDAGAGIGLGGDGERAADHRGAIRHEVQTGAQSLRAIGVEAAAIVLDAEELVFLRKIERDGDAPGVGMLDGVIDRLLRNPVQVQGVARLADGDRAAGDKAALDAVQPLHLEGQVLERRFEAAGLKLHGAKAAGERARLGDRFLDQGGDGRGLLGFGPALHLQLVAQRGAEAGDAGEVLAQPVVEIAADAVFFRIADAQQFALDELSLRDVAAEEKRPAAEFAVEEEEEVRIPLAAAVAGGEHGGDGATLQGFGDGRLELGIERGELVANHRGGHHAVFLEFLSLRFDDHAARIQAADDHRQVGEEAIEQLALLLDQLFRLHACGHVDGETHRAGAPRAVEPVVILEVVGLAAAPDFGDEVDRFAGQGPADRLHRMWKQREDARAGELVVAHADRREGVAAGFLDDGVVVDAGDRDGQAREAAVEQRRGLAQGFLGLDARGDVDRRDALEIPAGVLDHGKGRRQPVLSAVGVLDRTAVGRTLGAEREDRLKGKMVFENLVLEKDRARLVVNADGARHAAHEKLQLRLALPQRGKHVRVADRVADGALQPGGVERGFAEVIGRAGIEGGLVDLGIFRTREQDDRHLALLALQRAEKLQPGGATELVVEETHVEGALLQGVAGGSLGRRPRKLVGAHEAFPEEDFHEGKIVFVVVEHQDTHDLGGRFCAMVERRHHRGCYRMHGENLIRDVHAIRRGNRERGVICGAWVRWSNWRGERRGAFSAGSPRSTP